MERMLICGLVAGSLILGAGCAKHRAAEKPPPAPPKSEVVEKPGTESTSSEGHPTRGGSPPPLKQVTTVAQPPPGTPAPLEETTVLRSAARRLDAHHPKGLYTSYTGDPKLGFAGEDARKVTGRTLGAVIERFGEAKPESPEEQASRIARSGEIVALAIGAQLRVLGWDVYAELEQATGGRNKAEGKAGPPRDAFVVNGTVHVFHTRLDPSPRVSQQIAELQATVRFADGKGNLVYEKRIAARAQVSEQQVRDRIARRNQAARAALAAFVRELFEDPALATKLARVLPPKPSR